MYAFDYHRPRSIQDALAAAAVDDGAFLAGGMTLLPSLKMRLSRRSRLVDLAAIPELSGIRVDNGRVHIGAMTRHVEVQDSGAVRQAIPALAALAGGIGDPQVRNRGTIGGSLANSDPSADYPAAVLALDARIHTDQREIPADEFFTGMFATALQPGELITRISFPVTGRCAYVKYRNPASRYAVVGVMVAQHAQGVRVAVTGAGPHAFRLPEFEAVLSKSFAPDAVRSLRVPSEGLNEDMHATAAYRAGLISVIAARAVTAALQA
jgi:carbon-monoxide dehydrogenase medium subunit